VDGAPNVRVVRSRIPSPAAFREEGAT
jgi:hypothetical protein